MITLNKIVTILAERVGRQYDLIFKEELKTIVEYWRGTILRQALKDNPRDISYFQRSFVVEIERTFKVKCPFNYGCVMRTVEPLPQMIRNTQFPFSYVGNPDLEDGYTYILPFQLKSVQYSRNLNKSGKYYTIMDGYGYFYNIPEEQKYVGFTGIPQNVDDIKKYKKCGEDVLCYSDDSEYPLTADLVQRLVQAILGTELRNQVIDKDKDEVTLDGNS